MKTKPKHSVSKWRYEPWGMFLSYPDRCQWVGAVVVPMTRSVMSNGEVFEDSTTRMYYPDELSVLSGAPVAEIQALLAATEYAYKRLARIAARAAERDGGQT